jgi:aldose 1-epimerase
MAEPVMAEPPSSPNHIIRIAGDLALDLAPAIGGAIAGFAWRGEPLFRPTRPSDLAAGNVRGLACFPLVPCSNRVALARLSFAGQKYVLAPNFSDHPNAIHGNGWQRPWLCTALAPNSAMLELVHRPRDAAACHAWPFSYRATQHFILEADVLHATVTIDNIGERAMPAGLGLHPYFPRTASTRLGFRADSVWRNDATNLPIERVAADMGWRDGRDLAGIAIDTVFAGWDGTARIEWPERRLGLVIRSGPPLDRLVVYVPPEHDFLAVEPVSHDTDAFNRMAAGHVDTGTVVLAAGERLSGAITFSVESR